MSYGHALKFRAANTSFVCKLKCKKFMHNDEEKRLRWLYWSTAIYTDLGTHQQHTNTHTFTCAVRGSFNLQYWCCTYTRPCSKFQYPIVTLKRTNFIVWFKYLIFNYVIFHCVKIFMTFLGLLVINLVHIEILILFKLQNCTLQACMTWTL
jgi:hypothetical protein